jgi:hypothetical protein
MLLIVFETEAWVLEFWIRVQILNVLTLLSLILVQVPVCRLCHSKVSIGTRTYLLLSVLYVLPFVRSPTRPSLECKLRDRH